MTVIVRKSRKTAPAAEPNDHPKVVTVDVAEPFAVYFNGEQRTGTIEDVPWSLAVHWLRHRWANCAYAPHP